MHGQTINSNTNSTSNNTSNSGNSSQGNTSANANASASNVNSNKKRNEELKYLKQIPIEIVNNNKGEIGFNSITKPITPGNINDRYDINGSNNISNNEELDLIVTLIILPTLKEYQGTFRNNYNSRTWNKINHNGYSISVFKVNWCNLNNSIDKINSSEFNKKIINENIKNFKELNKNGIEIDVHISGQEGTKSESDENKEEIGNWCKDKNYWRKSFVNNK
ncbi:unnamed protein product [[Candida] boidinii]|nr:unnamed protein product [[Candida] boidinii]